jgi:SAM-dependent methyltransferase
MSDGWDESASAWIAEMGARGDYSREFILDAPMLERVRAGGFRSALDVGCGEGRFCRMLRALDIETIGVDPTAALIERARALDPAGDYRVGNAEALDVPDAAVDLVVAYLSFIDIPDIGAAVAEMARVLRPGGSLLVANHNGFATAAVGGGWTADRSGNLSFRIDHYLSERPEWAEWRSIRVQNWHRPLSRYMSLLIEQGLTLRYFYEPAPNGGDPAKADRYRRVPLFLIMEWRKPR